MPFPAFFLLAGALGAFEGIANRRAKGKLLDLEAERQDTINNIGVGIDAMGATNKFDARQIAAMTEQQNTAQALMRSKDPDQQRAGAQMMQSLATAVRSNIQQNETEHRADQERIKDAQILAAGLGKADNEKRIDRGIEMASQMSQELQEFTDTTRSYNKVINLLDNDDQLASLAGLTAFVQAIDNSVVREGELLKYQGANGFITQIVNLVNKAEGDDFDATTKQSIRNAAAALVNAEKTRASTIANSYQNRALAWELDVDKVMAGVDRNLFTPIPIDREAQRQRQIDADAAEQAMLDDSEEFVEDTGELWGVDVPGTGARITINPAENIENRLVRPFIDIISRVGRGLRGEKLLRKNDGTIWIESRDGKIRPVKNEDYLALPPEETGVQLTPAVQEQKKEFDARQEKRRITLRDQKHRRDIEALKKDLRKLFFFGESDENEESE